MKIIKLDLKMAVKAIREGKVLVCPTDTVYGLICDANNKKAVDKLFKIKKRPKNKPIPIFMKDIKMAKKFAIVDSEQEKFIKKIWASKGKVTVILRPKKKLPKGIGKPGKEIGLRIPNYKWLLYLVEQLKRPLAETSANISGKPASTKIKKVLRQFEGKEYQPDLVIDAGDLPLAKPSTVVGLTGQNPKILRK